MNIIISDLPSSAPSNAPGWRLLTARGRALVYIVDHPGCTKRELAEALHVTGRTVSSILAELKLSGAVRATNGSGRPRHYEADLNAPVETSEGRTTLSAILSGVD